MEQLIRQLITAYDLPVPEALPSLLAQHWQLVLAGNQRFNLTAILTPEEAAEKHYLDSLLGLPLLDQVLSQPAQICDLGSGAGFPGIPLAAARPQHSFLLLDATAKKGIFLDECADALRLTNYSAACSRAEEAARLPELRERFDLVTARAVASLPELIELAFPLLKTGGHLLTYKGASFDREAEAAGQALSILQGKIAASESYVLPNGETRILALVQKLAPTADKFPRRPGMAHKRPL